MTRYGFYVNRAGSQHWTRNGMLHRDDDLPAHISHDGRVLGWFQFGKRHRVGGPAMEWSNGTSKWFLNGKLHREDGPAVVYGELKRPHNAWFDRSPQYWLHGEPYSESEYFKLRPSSPLAGMVVKIDGVSYTMTPHI